MALPSTMKVGMYYNNRDVRVEEMTADRVAFHCKTAYPAGVVVKVPVPDSASPDIL